MTYKESLVKAMDELAQDRRRLFIGYNTRFGSRANGTLLNVPIDQCIETPVAESLMGGMAVGLSLNGFRPLVYFERFDFILNALDAIVNHLDKMDMMSGGQFSPKAIIRVVIGSKTAPLFTGPTHTQDFTEAMRKLVKFDVIELKRGLSPHEVYRQAKDKSAMIIEYRELYQETLHEITHS